MQLQLEQVRKKLSITRMNKGITIGSVRRFCKEDSKYKLDFDVWLPSKGMYLQRGLVWTLEQKQEFIISMLKGIKVPAICAVQIKDGDVQEFQIIDGKQRLTTAIGFAKGEFPIIWEGQQYYFADLERAAQSEISGDHYFKWDIAYHYPDSPVTDEQKIEWFEQINFTGTPQDVEHLNKLKGKILV